MARRTATPPASVPTEDQIIAFTEAVEQLVEALGEVKTLTQEVRVLRDAIDDARQELEWIARNLPRPAWTPTPQLTSFPKDALAPDFHERVNRYRAEDLPPAESPSPPSASSSGETGQLF